METQSESFFHFELNKVISLYPVYDSSGDFTHKWVDSNGTDYTDEVDHGTCVEESAMDCAPDAEKMQYLAYRLRVEGLDANVCGDSVYAEFGSDVTDQFNEEIENPKALVAENIAFSLGLDGALLQNQNGDLDLATLKYEA